MANIAMIVKFALFLGMEIFVVALTLGMLILALRKIVQDSVRQARRAEKARRRRVPIVPTPAAVEVAESQR